jgi:hypothetical protein
MTERTVYHSNTTRCPAVKSEGSIDPDLNKPVPGGLQSTLDAGHTGFHDAPFEVDMGTWVARKNHRWLSMEGFGKGRDFGKERRE